LGVPSDFCIEEDGASENLALFGVRGFGAWCGCGGLRPVTSAALAILATDEELKVAAFLVGGAD
jgi:hypothetical protein